MQCNANANAVWRKESWECGPQTANRMPLWRRGRVVSMCYGGVRTKATDMAVVCSHHWRTVRVLPPCMRESRDSSMAIGARDAGTWYRTKNIAGGRVPGGVSWFDDNSHATSPWPAVSEVSTATPQSWPRVKLPRVMAEVGDKGTDRRCSPRTSRPPFVLLILSSSSSSAIYYNQSSFFSSSPPYQQHLPTERTTTNPATISPRTQSPG